MSKELVPYEDVPRVIKNELQNEIDKIGDNQDPYYLYHNVVNSTGTAGSLARIFGLPFSLVLKIRELNGFMQNDEDGKWVKKWVKKSYKG